MKAFVLLILIGMTQFASTSFACGAHPNMTHAQWTSTFAAEKDKQGNEQSMSAGFWNSKPGAPGQDPATAPPAPSNDGERKITEHPVN